MATQDLWIGPDQCLPGQEHNIVETAMKEDGIDYPVMKCTKCAYWG